jgi:Ca2+-dependent lipid-binding protein
VVVSEDVLNVRVIDAKSYEKQDIFGQGDPYVKIKFDIQSFRTKTVKDTKTAIYNEGISIY